MLWLAGLMGLFAVGAASLAGVMEQPEEDTPAPEDPGGPVNTGVTTIGEIIGTFRDDTLSGGAEDDILRGGGGDDEIGGYGGDDLVDGGAGADDLHGAGRDDTVMGDL